MSTRKSSWSTVAIISLSSIGLFAPAVFAQHGPGAQHQQGAARHADPAQTPAYDTKTVATIKGTIDEVKTDGRMMGAGRMGVQDQHLVLKTDTGTIDVQLGPATFLAEKKVHLTKGDTVEVIGSTVTVGESQVLLAREIRKGDTSWTLRDTSGAPLWTTGGHGPHR